MPQFLRAIYAGPRKLHSTTGLDLCYVSRDPTIICLSRPVTAYPQVLFCNPLSELLEFIHNTHPPSDTSPIRVYNLRGEHPGYHDHDFLHNLTATAPSSALIPNKTSTTTSTPSFSPSITIHHAPWPDHHPPPLCLLLATIADMNSFVQNNIPTTPSTTSVRSRSNSITTSTATAPQTTTPSQTTPSQNKETDSDSDANTLTTTTTTLAAGLPPIPSKGGVILVHCKAGKGRSGTLITSYLIAYQNHTYDTALATFTNARMKTSMGQGVSIRSQCRYVRYVETIFSQPVRPDMRDRRVRVKRIVLVGVAKGGDVGVEVRGYAFDTSHARGIWAIRKVWEGGVVRVEKEKVEGVQGGERVEGEAGGDAVSSEDEPDIAIADISSSSSTSSSPTTATATKTSTSVICETADVSVAFTHTSLYGIITLSKTRIWFNAVAESIDGNSSSNSGVFSVLWEEVDGVKGTSWKGRKAFERVDVEWEFVGDGEDGDGVRANGRSMTDTDVEVESLEGKAEVQ